MTKKEKIAIISSIIYIAMMGVGMFVLKNVSGSDYGSIDMVNTLIYFEIIMTLFAVIVYRKYFRGLSFNTINKFPINSFITLFFSIMFLLLIMVGVFYFLSARHITKDIRLVFMIIITTFFVGVSEELIFRGIVLPTLVEKRGTIMAVIISSIIFGFLHSVNILGGMSVNAMLVQLILSTIVGVLFACVALEIQNIIPLMIYHWFWDAFLMIEQYYDFKEISFMTILSLIEYFCGFILFFILIVQHKKLKLKYK